MGVCVDEAGEDGFASEVDVRWVDRFWLELSGVDGDYKAGGGVYCY